MDKLESTADVEQRSSGEQFRVLPGGVDKTGNVTIPRTLGDPTWTTVTKTGVNLEADIQGPRIQVVTGTFNLNWIEIAP